MMKLTLSAFWLRLLPLPAASGLRAFAAGGWLEGRTRERHRPALLRLTRRVVVMDNGHIIADGAREAVLNSFLPAKPVGKEHAA